MNKFIIVPFVLLIFLNLSLYGQEVLEEDKVDVNEENLDFEIEEDDGEESAPETTFLSYWDEHFILGLGTSIGIYNSGTRFSSFLGLSYEEKINFLRFKFAGDLKYKYHNLVVIEIENPTVEKEIISKTDFKKDFFTLRDFYFQLDLFSIMKFTIGRKLIVWGQFDIISPVDYILPSSFNDNSIVINKIANRLPQDVAQLDIYPTDFLEFQFYWFPNYTVSNDLSDFLGIGEYPKGLFDPYLRDWYGNFDGGQYAVRALGYFGSVTLAFTYMYTWDPGKFHALDDLKNNPSYNSVNTRDNNNSHYNVTMNKIGLARSQNIGAEMSLQTGQWVWKAEAMYTRTVDDLDGFSFFTEELSEIGEDTPESFFTYADWIINNNGGRLYGSLNRILAGIGVTGELERWKFDLNILSYHLIKSDHSKKGAELGGKLIGDILNREFSGGSGGSSDPDFEFDDVQFIPAVNIIWYSVPSKKGGLGIAGGLLPIGLGGLIYYIHEIAEIVTPGGSVELLVPLSEATENYKYQLKSSYNLGGRFVASLRL